MNIDTLQEFCRRKPELNELKDLYYSEELITARDYGWVDYNDDKRQQIVIKLDYDTVYAFLFEGEALQDYMSDFIYKYKEKYTLSGVATAYHDIAWRYWFTASSCFD